MTMATLGEKVTRWANPAPPLLTSPITTPIPHSCTSPTPPRFPLCCIGQIWALAAWISVYGAHFYVSMNVCTSLGPHLGSHNLSNIYTFRLVTICKWTVVPLHSNGNENAQITASGGCCQMQKPIAKYGRHIQSRWILGHLGTNLSFSTPRFYMLSNSSNGMQQSMSCNQHSVPK